jgi:hypothetical protein
VERLAIWRLALHERAPSGETLLDGIGDDVDFSIDLGP